MARMSAGARGRASRRPLADRAVLTSVARTARPTAASPSRSRRLEPLRRRILPHLHDADLPLGVSLPGRLDLRRAAPLGKRQERDPIVLEVSTRSRRSPYRGPARSRRRRWCPPPFSRLRRPLLRNRFAACREGKDAARRRPSRREPQRRQEVKGHRPLKGGGSSSARRTGRRTRRSQPRKRGPG
jgi:hypothetical protein